MKRRRWIVPAVLVVIVGGAAVAVGWFRAGPGATGATSAPGSQVSAGTNNAVCGLSELPGTSVAKEVWASIARVDGGVIAAGTRYTASQAGAFVAHGSSEGWKTQRLGGFERQVTLEDVSDDRAGGAWAVGVMVRVPAVARWNGATWSADALTGPGPSLDVLSGVVAVSPRLAWGVGRYDDGVAYRTLVERWDGTGWSAVASPDVGSAPNVLKDVAATGPDDAWAVGWQVEERRYRTLAEHWDGARWTVVPTPDLGRGKGDAVLTGVAALSPHDVWSVGWITRGDVQRPVVERWNGSRWTTVSLPSDLGPAGLFAVSPTTDGVAVVGRRFVDQEPQPLALLHDPTGWHEVAINASPASQAWLTGVATDASGTLWAVGNRLDSDGLFASLVVNGCRRS
jgi:hypothetical protein